MIETSERTPDPTADVWVEATRRAIQERESGYRRNTKERTKPWARFKKRFLKQRAGMVAVVFLLLVVLTAVFAPWLAPLDPNKQNLGQILQYPSAEHLLGTDDLGRDVLSRLLYGAQVSLVAAVQATGIGVLLGLPFGLIAGYAGGRTDRAIMFVNDALMSMPGLLLAIAIVGMLGPGLTNAMVAIGIVFAPHILRIVRGSVMEVKEETYIEASRSLGTPTSRIIVDHVLRNVRSPFIVGVSLMTGRAMLNEASLSFLGMGAQYPDASWGAMLGRAFPYVDRAPFLIIYPGIAIALVVLAFNIAGDALRDSLGRETRKS
ncbi:ABC transporter permease [Arthrobacter sp. I2-34]|uniref:ABC transporter permease n=1 Tax=Arthrobacter hankyongi TaxID=2904801 RepID=A0ABS9L9R8_9MICC|nr:ABC transporter permease [Arthrobacter hankyongi]MCG2623431.1 ABC transporter permease [Arthrobacter hankyongi]